MDTIKWARDLMAAMLKTPKMWGSYEVLEAQLLLLLQVTMVASGKDPMLVTQVHEEMLVERYGTKIVNASRKEDFDEATFKKFAFDLIGRCIDKLD